MVSPELLRRYPLFAGQNQYMLDEIAMLSNEVEKDEGQWLFHENEEADKLYLIRDGAIELTLFVYVGGEEKQLSSSSSLGKDEIVGWSAVVPPHQYKLGARVVKKSSLLEIDAAPLRQLLDDNPEYGYFFIQKIVEVISERFMYIQIQLLSLIADKDPVGADKT